MIILKFGGTSVGSEENIKKIGAIIQTTANKNEQVIVVVSAIKNMTNQLLRMCSLAAEGERAKALNLLQESQAFTEDVSKALSPSYQTALQTTDTYFEELNDLIQGIYLLRDASDKTKDQVMSYGELISSHIIAHYIQEKVGLQTKWVDSRELIRTDSVYGNASVFAEETYKNINAYITKYPNKVILAPGFIASNKKGETTTIGRGGSDYSAVLYAVGSSASSLEIWTDVSGIMSADPRLVPHAKVIERIPYGTALELSHFGAKVVFAHTFIPAMERNIPILIKNTLQPEEKGTTITQDDTTISKTYTGISSIDDVSLISIQGSDALQFISLVRRLFDALHNCQIPVLLTTQGSSEHYICIAIASAYRKKTLEAIQKEFSEEIVQGRTTPPTLEKDLAVLALIGDNMKSHQGISGRMFTALGKNGVNIRAIAQGASEKNISALISKRDIRKATLVLHEEFFEEKYKQLHVFITGIGNVGSKLIEQIKQQHDFLKNHMRLHIKIIGIANSKKMLIDLNGIDLSSWENQITHATEKKSINEYAQAIIDANLRNSVFLDITANEEVASAYEVFLKKSISVVACNKIACSGPYVYYKEIKTLSKKYNASLMFETNVGAGLPVIDTLSGLVQSGDKIESIEAVLSGTLNLVFNLYDGSKPFASIVRYAHEAGYTEPDPRLDLSGQDVARKILILAREIGETLEMESVDIEGFLPASAMQGDISHFYEELEKNEEIFRNLYTKAKEKNCILKHVATFKDGRAKVGLKQIPEGHNLYYLDNKDNIVLFHTNRYNEQPLVIKGAGAGADVTASGLFADILKTLPS